MQSDNELKEKFSSVKCASFFGVFYDSNTVVLKTSERYNFFVHIQLGANILFNEDEKIKFKSTHDTNIWMQFCIMSRHTKYRKTCQQL